MTKATQNPAGFLTFTLHAHLPYVVNHGTWPHGMEWLHEAAAETYLPLLRVLKNLEHDKIRFNCNLNLSPILLEQLAHPVGQRFLSSSVESTSATFGRPQSAIVRITVRAGDSSKSGRRVEVSATFSGTNEPTIAVSRDF